MRVLVVDDSQVMRRILREQLAVLDAEVVESDDGSTALALLQTDRDFDLILLDWNMPELDGFTVLGKLKASPATMSIPVVMVTTEAEKENVIMAIQAGASSYVVKPFEPHTLMHKIQKVLALKT